MKNWKGTAILTREFAMRLFCLARFSWRNRCFTHRNANSKRGIGVLKRVVLLVLVVSSVAICVSGSPADSQRYTPTCEAAGQMTPSNSAVGFHDVVLVASHHEALTVAGGLALQGIVFLVCGFICHNWSRRSSSSALSADMKAQHEVLQHQAQTPTVESASTRVA
jgi:hypothetical protein